ncbi:polysaccharide biosynthesis tyrosine autokinase [Geodermatophilus sp. URMC 61]|uniref:polysaccharide biosynthesis tyrosine autokinase n=1 Tax=Geodermatophilus sp. URMC 61 TaxID=3423411 RepID=UPI00406C3936
MNLREVFAALRGWWWLPLIGLLIGGALALAVSLLQTALYTSSTQLFVSTRATTSTTEAYQGSQFSQQRVTSYARLITGEELAGRVIDRLGLDETPGELSDQITATATPGTVLIDVTVTDPSADQAQRIADALGDEFTVFVAELETPDDAGMSPVKVTVTDEPEVASAPSSPETARNVALGLLVGALLGAGLAILRARLDHTVKDPDEVVELAGAPVIGTVLRDEVLEKQHTIDRNSANRTAEDYRQLRNNLQFLNVDEPPKVIMVSSALPSEGKTTAVVNLGLALADAGRRVTIVEADLRKPKVTRYLGMVGGVGLTNILAGTADLDEVIQRYGAGELSVIAAGPTPPNPGELLSSSHMFALLDKLRVENDFVLVDAPPLLPVADSTGLAVYMDGVLLSVRYGSTRKEQLQQAAATLERVGAKTLGVILNIVPPKAELSTAYGYGYSYGYDQPGKGATAAG